MHHLLVLTKHPDEYRALIEAANCPDLAIVAASDVPDGIARGAHSDLLLGDPTRVTQALPHLPRLVWTQLTWAGVEPMLDPALRRDYVLTNIRGVFGPLMSEYVFGYLLALERKMLTRYEAQREGRWDATLPGTLQGKARHFGMRVHGYTRSSRDCPHVHRYFHTGEKTAFASGVDYLVAVLPNTHGTRRIVDAEMLGALPPHAVVVNAGRGDTIDEAALIDALTQGRVAAAVLDVFPEEPLPPQHPFWRTPNTFITSHTSAPSFPRDIVGVFVENYRRFHGGKPLLHRVDFERGY